MFDLINNGGDGDGNGIGMEEGTQAKAYDIDGQPLFDMSSANYTTFYADGQGEDESEEDEDIEADPGADVSKYVAVDATAMGTATMAKTKKISKRTACYRPNEDVCLCQSWLAISQYTIFGVEQKGKAYWRRVTVDYHERRQLLKPFKMHSDHGQKRDGPSSNKRPTSFAALLRLSNADP
jgi:hypothetical protein